MGLGLSRLRRGSEPEAECATNRGPPCPAPHGLGSSGQTTMGRELARVAAGWATEGTSLRTPLKCIFKHCSRAVGAGKPQPPTSLWPGQPGAGGQAGSGGGRPRGTQAAGRPGVGRARPGSPTEGLSQWQGGLHRWPGPCSKLRNFKMAAAELQDNLGALLCVGPFGHVFMRPVLASRLFAGLPAPGSSWQGTWVLDTM